MSPRSATRLATARGRGAAAGFTLLEIMLAVGLLGVVIAIVYGVFARTLAAKEHTEARAAETATARSILNRIERDLLAALPGKSSPVPRPSPTPGVGLPKAVEQYLFVSRNRTDGGAPFDELSFSALVRRPAGIALSAADLAVIRYFVEADPANPERKVLFRETTYSLSGAIFDPENPNPDSTVRLLDGIAALEFRFFDGREWVQEWDSEDRRNFGPAPQAVEISLALRSDRNEPEVFRTAVDLPIVRAAPLPLGAPGRAGAGAPPADEEEEEP
jgi:general secretion pathway protein J